MPAKRARYVQDLWNIGRAVGIHGFKNEDTIDTELKQMASEMAKAKRDDRKLTPDLEARSRSFLQRLIQGTPDAHSVGTTQHRVDTNFRVANAKWMKIVRAKYEGAVIRRGIDSVDNKGEPISGLDPYLESVCMLKLYDHEYAALEQLAENALDKKSVARRFSSEVSTKRYVQMELCANVPQNFYLQIRRCLLHPCFANLGGVEEEVLSKDYTLYSKARSSKIESIVEIVKHHLLTDDAPAMRPSRQRPPEAFLMSPSSSSSNSSPSPSPSAHPSAQQTLQPRPTHCSSPTVQEALGHSMPDKIVIYSYFTSSFDLIRLVSHRPYY